MKKALLITGITAIVLILGFYALNAYIYEKQGDGNIESYFGTLTGEMVCLPHKDTTGPQTKECAIGMKTDVGEHYGLDFSVLSQTRPDIETGDRFTASGRITPIEMLSSDHWQKYDVKGILSVGSVQKI